MSSLNLDAIFDSFYQMRVGVIGDIMLDTYWWGRVDRISPEAPVPVVAVSSREYRMGGAGNVALNVKSLGAGVSILSVTGKDEEGMLLKRMIEEQGIDARNVMLSARRITTNKIRILGRNQQMMRLDAEVDDLLDIEEEAGLMNAVSVFLDETRPDLIILEDYNKGVLTPRLIGWLIGECKKRSIITAVDPKRKHFFEFREADIFKPNLQEVKDALNLIHAHVSLDALRSIHKALHDRLNHSISLITLSEKGIFYQDSDNADIIPTHVRSIADVSGAGDTVIAVAGLVYASTRNARLMAEVANIAGGLVCEQVGTAAIDRYALKEECQKLLD